MQQHGTPTNLHQTSWFTVAVLYLILVLVTTDSCSAIANHGHQIGKQKPKIVVFNLFLAYHLSYIA